MPVLSKVHPAFLADRRPTIQGPDHPSRFRVDDSYDLAWTRLKEALVSDAILVHPDYTRDFLLDCDGSGEALGAVLLQAYAEGEKVVAYASWSLLEHEKKWTASALEAAALIWALETLRPYIDGVHVTIRTDHIPLEYIRSKADRCKRLERWAFR